MLALRFYFGDSPPAFASSVAVMGACCRPQAQRETPALPAALPQDPGDMAETGDRWGHRGPADHQGRPEREYVFLGQKETLVSPATVVLQVGGSEETLGGFREATC